MPKTLAEHVTREMNRAVTETEKQAWEKMRIGGRGDVTVDFGVARRVHALLSHDATNEETERVLSPLTGDERAYLRQVFGVGGIAKRWAHSIISHGVDMPTPQVNEATLTRKHFEMFAQMVANESRLTLKQRARVADILADLFAQTNPLFNRDRFMRAAGITGTLAKDDGNDVVVAEIGEAQIDEGNLTKKHFIALANAVANTSFTPGVRAVVADMLARMLTLTNPAFNRDIFVRACGTTTQMADRAAQGATADSLDSLENETDESGDDAGDVVDDVAHVADWVMEHVPAQKRDPDLLRELQEACGEVDLPDVLEVGHKLAERAGLIDEYKRMQAAAYKRSLRMRARPKSAAQRQKNKARRIAYRKTKVKVQRAKRIYYRRFKNRFREAVECVVMPEPIADDVLSLLDEHGWYVTHHEPAQDGRVEMDLPQDVANPLFEMLEGSITYASFTAALVEASRVRNAKFNPALDVHDFPMNTDGMTVLGSRRRGDDVLHFHGENASVISKAGFGILYGAVGIPAVQETKLRSALKEMGYSLKITEYGTDIREDDSASQQNTDGELTEASSKSLYVLYVNMDNAALEADADESNAELARILRVAAKSAEDGEHWQGKKTLRDINGNTVGQAGFGVKPGKSARNESEDIDDDDVNAILDEYKIDRAKRLPKSVRKAFATELKRSRRDDEAGTASGRANSRGKRNMLWQRAMNWHERRDDDAPSLSEGTKYQFPGIRELVKHLKDIQDDLKAEGEKEIDVRLQVTTSDWELHSGDSGGDLSHKGVWGASSVGVKDSLNELKNTAADLIDQAKDGAAEREDDDDDDDEDYDDDEDTDESADVDESKPKQGTPGGKPFVLGQKVSYRGKNWRVINFTKNGEVVLDRIAKKNDPAGGTSVTAKPADIGEGRYDFDPARRLRRKTRDYLARHVRFARKWRRYGMHDQVANRFSELRRSAQNYNDDESVFVNVTSADRELVEAVRRMFDVDQSKAERIVSTPGIRDAIAEGLSEGDTLLDSVSDVLVGMALASGTYTLSEADQNDVLSRDVVKRAIEQYKAEGMSDEDAKQRALSSFADILATEDVDESDDPSEPEDDDITTEDYEKWYQSGKLYHRGDEKSLKRKMDADEFWPNVWHISDHGNALLLKWDNKRKEFVQAESTSEGEHRRPFVDESDDSPDDLAYDVYTRLVIGRKLDDLALTAAQRKGIDRIADDVRYDRSMSKKQKLKMIGLVLQKPDFFPDDDEDVDEGKDPAARLSVPEKHQLKIAKSTLRLSDPGARIMGGMSKDDARKFLKRIGYTDKQIANIEGPPEQNEGVDEAGPKHVFSKLDWEPASGGGNLKLVYCKKQNAIVSLYRDAVGYSVRWSDNRKADEQLFDTGELEQATNFADSMVQKYGGMADSGTVRKQESVDEAVRDYGTNKPKSDPTYNKQWSGKTGAPRIKGKRCAKCGGAVHKEGDSAYCPKCDDYVSTKNESDIDDVLSQLSESDADDAKKFFNAYVTAALWSSNDDDGEPLDSSYDESDIDRQSMNAMKSDCLQFIRANKALLDQAMEVDDRYDYAKAGHDFWLSRNGHGAGFFDRGNEPVWDKLQDAAKREGSVDLYVGDDGKIHDSINRQDGASEVDEEKFSLSALDNKRHPVTRKMLDSATAPAQVLSALKATFKEADDSARIEKFRDELIAFIEALRGADYPDQKKAWYFSELVGALIHAYDEPVQSWKNLKLPTAVMQFVMKSQSKDWDESVDEASGDYSWKIQVEFMRGGKEHERVEELRDSSRASLPTALHRFVKKYRAGNDADGIGQVIIDQFVGGSRKWLNYYDSNAKATHARPIHKFVQKLQADIDAKDVVESVDESTDEASFWNARERPIVYEMWRKPLQQLRSILRKEGYTTDVGSAKEAYQSGMFLWYKTVGEKGDPSGEMNRIAGVLKSALSKEFYAKLYIGAGDDDAMVRLDFGKVGGMALPESVDEASNKPEWVDRGDWIKLRKTATNRGHLLVLLPGDDEPDPHGLQSKGSLRVIKPDELNSPWHKGAKVVFDPRKKSAKTDEAKVRFVCLECGKKFTSASDDPECPKCGSTDYEVDESAIDDEENTMNESEIITALDELEAALDEMAVAEAKYDAAAMDRAGQRLQKAMRPVQANINRLRRGQATKKVNPLVTRRIRRAQWAMDQRRRGLAQRAGLPVKKTKTTWREDYEAATGHDENLNESPIITANSLRRVFPKLSQEAASGFAKRLGRAPQREAVEELMKEISDAAGAYGVESVSQDDAPKADRPGGYWYDTVLLYINKGDTYDTTLCYDTNDDTFFIGSWGDFVEQNYDGIDADESEIDDALSQLEQAIESGDKDAIEEAKKKIKAKKVGKGSKGKSPKPKNPGKRTVKPEIDNDPNATSDAKSEVVGEGDINYLRQTRPHLKHLSDADLLASESCIRAIAKATGHSLDEIQQTGSEDAQNGPQPADIVTADFNRWFQGGKLLFTGSATQIESYLAKTPDSDVWLVKPDGTSALLWTVKDESAATLRFDGRHAARFVQAAQGLNLSEKTQLTREPNGRFSVTLPMPTVKLLLPLFRGDGIDWS